MILLNFTMLYYWSTSPQVKHNLMSSTVNIVQVLSDELKNYTKHRLLGNYEILEKSKVWLKTESNAQSSFQKLNFGNSS